MPSMSIQMHKIHCERNTVKCTSCGEKMNKLELEKHIAETHALKKCETCSIELEVRFFITHDCPKKPVMCDFCEAFLPKDQFRVHQLDCGNRTEECSRCRDFIKRRDYKEHIKARKCKDYSEKLREQEQEKEMRRRREAEDRKKEAELLKKIEESRKVEEYRKKYEESKKKTEEDKKKSDLDVKKKIIAPESSKVGEKKYKNEDKKPKEEGKNKPQVGKAKPVNFNSRSRSGNEAGKAVIDSRERVNSFNPKPSPKISSKPAANTNLIGPEDYEDIYNVPDEIPPIPDDFDERQVNFPPPRRKSPAPLAESMNFADYDNQILQQVLAESKKEFVGAEDSIDDDILSQVLLNSIKEK